MIGALLAASVIAAMLGGGALVAWHFSPAHQFHTARTRWQQQPIPHYRLIIERPSLNCRQDVEVRNEQIVRTMVHNCPIELLTMTDLFDRIAWLDGLHSTMNFPGGGCGCESYLRAYVVYHPEHAYPVEVGISDRRRFNWREPACWQHMLTHGALPECDATFLFGQPRITNITLTALP
jgi:hypothetical protein